MDQLQNLQDSYPWHHPFTYAIIATVFFIIVRLIFGGAPFMPSRAWQAFCILLPLFNFAINYPNAMCFPLNYGWQIWAHVAITIAYFQVDIMLNYQLSSDEGKENFGEKNIFMMIISKFTLKSLPSTGGTPGVIAMIFIINGAFHHEAYWNIVVYKNLTDWGQNIQLAAVFVSLFSSLLHGIVCNVQVGFRCLSIFLRVALSYHASHSVVTPALIHTMWQLSEAKFLNAANTMKTDWNLAELRDETWTLPPWRDRKWMAGFTLMIIFYIPLNILCDLYPVLKADYNIQGPCEQMEYGSMDKQNGQSIFMMVTALLQFIIGVATWGPTRAGMDIICETGDTTKRGQEISEKAVQAYFGNSKVADGENEVV